MVDVRTHQRVLAGSPGMLSPEHGTPSRHITHNGSRIAPSRAASTTSSSEDTKDFLHYHRAEETKEEEPQQDQTWCVHCTRNIRWMNWLSHVNSHGHQLAVGLYEKRKKRGQHAGTAIDYGVFRSQTVKQDIPEVIGLHHLLVSVKVEEEANELKRVADARNRQRRLQEQRENMSFKLTKWRVNAGVKKLKGNSTMDRLSKSKGQLRHHQASVSKLGVMEVKREQKVKNAGGGGGAGMPAIFSLLPNIIVAKADKHNKSAASTWNNFGAGHAHPSKAKRSTKKGNATTTTTTTGHHKKAVTFGGFGSAGGFGTGVGNSGVHAVKKSSPWGNNTSPLKSPFAGRGGKGGGTNTFPKIKTYQPKRASPQKQRNSPSPFRSTATRNLARAQEKVRLYGGHGGKTKGQ